MNELPIVVACPHCHCLNRVPGAKLGQGPQCGKCHQPIFVGKPVALTGAEFDRHALNSELPLLVDFWAPWCGPCLSMAPQFEAAAKSLEPRMRLAKVDTQAEQELGAQFDIRSIPTMVMFQGGREINRQSGAMGAAQIVQWANGQLG